MPISNQRKGIFNACINHVGFLGRVINKDSLDNQEDTPENLKRGSECSCPTGFQKTSRYLTCLLSF